MTKKKLGLNTIFSAQELSMLGILITDTKGKKTLSKQLKHEKIKK